MGLDEIYHGPDGYCESMEQWSQSFRNWRAEVDEVIEEAPDRILIIARHSGEGIASGVELEQWGTVRYTVRHGRIVRVDGFFGPDREGVVEAIGVQDQESVGRTAVVIAAHRLDAMAKGCGARDRTSTSGTKTRRMLGRSGVGSMLSCRLGVFECR